jgi:DNA-binding SARP family transcriptional activator
MDHLKFAGVTLGRLDVSLLGPVEVHADGRQLDLGGPQPRAVVAHLALDHGRVVSVERLVARLWGEAPPASPLASLQTTLSRLRRVLEPDRVAGEPPTVIASEPPGYVLRVPADAVDLVRFRELALDGRRAAASALHHEARARFEAALAEWRGPALGGIGPDDVVAPIVLSLEEERLAVIQDRFDVLLALGLHVEAVAELSVAVSEHPLKEGLWSALAIALYRSQRQADALRAIDQARRTLIDELGLDPGPGLRELERRILDQDPALLAVPLVAEPQPPVAPATRSSDARFVGRSEEWGRLVAALDRAERGAPSLVMIEGEAGIGKSAIAERLLAHATDHGWNVALGHCVDGELAPSLWPIVEILRDLGVEVDPGDSARVAANTGRTPVEIADEVLRALDASGSGRRWCILLDDAHWADRPTLDVLMLVCERLRERRVLVITAFRPVATVPESALHDVVGSLIRAPGSERIVLEPLGEVEVAEILRRAASADPTPDAVRMVHARSGGNPFFVGELARLFGEGGIGAGDRVPDAVRDVVRARLAPLPQPTTGLLQLAAVAGERLDVPVLVEASGLDDDAFLDMIDPSIVTRMLVPAPNGELRFAHSLVRDAVLIDIAPLQLARLHRTVADALERKRGTGVDVIETIARHRLAGLPVGDPIRIAEQLVDASAVARWRGAFDTSDELAEQALELVRQTRGSFDVDAVVVRALESIVVNSGKRAGAPAAPEVAVRIDEIARRADCDAGRSLALYVRWWAMDVDPIAGYAELADAAAALADRTPSSFARLLGYHVAGTQAFQEGRIDDATRLLEAAIDAAGFSDPCTLNGFVPNVYLPAMAGIVAQLRGDDSAAQTHVVDRHAAWFRARGRVDPTTSIDIGFTIALVAAIRADAGATRRALIEVDFAGAPPWAAHLANGCGVLEGWAATMLGDSEGPGRALAALDRLDRGVAIRMIRPVFRTFGGQALLHVGDAGARDVLAIAHAETLERGEVWWLAETLRLRSRAERRFGDPEKATALLDEARHVAARQGARLLIDRLAAESD